LEREDQAPIHARNIAEIPPTLKEIGSETRTKREGVSGKQMVRIWRTEGKKQED
jgi:hypothetical protein